MRGMRNGRPGRAGDAVLVTGSSTGLGLETALQLAGEGFVVFATVRDLAQRQRRPGGRGRPRRRPRGAAARPRRRRRASSRRCTPSSTRRAAIYALVNNAGIGLRGCVEDCSPDEIRDVFETNVLGTIAVTRAAICRTCARPAAAGS